ALIARRTGDFATAAFDQFDAGGQVLVIMRHAEKLPADVLALRRMRLAQQSPRLGSKIFGPTTHKAATPMPASRSAQTRRHVAGSVDLLHNQRPFVARENRHALDPGTRPIRRRIEL